MLAELQNSLVECLCNPITQVEIPSGGGDDVLATGIRVEVGLNEELRKQGLAGSTGITREYVQYSVFS